MAKNSNNHPVVNDGATVKKKWWTKNKIIAISVIGVAVIAAIIVAVIMLSNSINPIPSTEEEAKVVGTVGGYEVKHEELRYITLLHKESLDVTMGKYETLTAEEKAEYEALLNSRVASDLKKNYVILALCADYGIDINSSEANDYVNEQIKAYVKEAFEGNMTKYKEWLAENNLTDSFVRLNYKINFLESKLFNHFVENKIDIVYDEQSIPEFIEYVMNSEEWIRTIHVYYPKKSEFMTAAKSYSRICEARENLAGIWYDDDRYDEICKEIGRAPFVSEISTTGNGTYFTYGQMDDAYESAAFALDFYEVSDIVETQDGFFVIMRLPLQESDVKARVDTLLVYHQYASLKKQMDAKSETLAFVGNEYYNSISLVEME